MLSGIPAAMARGLTLAWARDASYGGSRGFAGPLALNEGLRHG